MRRGLEEGTIGIDVAHKGEEREIEVGFMALEGKAKSPHKNALTRKEDSDCVSLTLLP